MTIPARAVPISQAAETRHIAMTRGLALMCAAMVILPAMDAVAKLLSSGLSPGQINFTRFALQAVLTGPILAVSLGWRAILPNRLAGNLLRGALAALASCMFFVAIKYMPLADALAVFFVEPFILTVLSALVMKERVGWRRRIAVAVGFLGALLVIQPSYGLFGLIALLPLGAAVVFSIYLILNKRFSAHDSALSMQFWGGVGGAMLMILVLAVGRLAGVDDLSTSVPDLREWSLLTLMGALAAVGHLLMIAAFRRAPASVLAPFQYLEIVGATVLGYALFGDFPDFWKWVGILIIVGSGGYVFWRESQMR